jgi:hypothetical protein
MRRVSAYRRPRSARGSRDARPGPTSREREATWPRSRSTPDDECGDLLRLLVNAVDERHGARTRTGRYPAGDDGDLLGTDLWEGVKAQHASADLLAVGRGYPFEDH